MTKRKPFGGFKPSDWASTMEATNGIITITPDDYLSCGEFPDGAVTCKVASLDGVFYADFNFHGKDDPTIISALIPGVVIPHDMNFEYRPERTMKCTLIDNPNTPMENKTRGDGGIMRHGVNLACEFIK